MTMDAQHPRAVAVAGGRILYVGSDQGVEEWIGPKTEVVDLAGGTLVPGFQDSHIHLVGGGLRLDSCQLDNFATQEEILAEIRRYAETHSDRPWILGGGWQLPAFPQANPHKSLLDAIVPDRPVALSAADGHSVWANSRALELAHITRETPDPPNGRIERDATGEPTGTLRESAAGLLSAVVPNARRKTTSTDLTIPVLGPERSRWLYPIGAVAKTGAVVVGGSDWPVSSMNPLEAIQIGITRRDPAAGSGPAWLPEHTVDLDILLAAYTIQGAFAAFQEKATGSIEVGKRADLVVLDKNLHAGSGARDCAGEGGADVCGGCEDFLKARDILIIQTRHDQTCPDRHVPHTPLREARASRLRAPLLVARSI